MYAIKMPKNRYIYQKTVQWNNEHISNQQLLLLLFHGSLDFVWDYLGEPVP